MFIDTHAHLDFTQFDHDREEVIRRAAEAGVGLIINVGADLSGSRNSLALAAAHKNIFASVGIHPHYAAALRKEDITEIEKLSHSDKFVANGEVGLDY